MILEKIDAQSRAFTIRFSESDVIHLSFGADKYGYTEMRVGVVKKDDEDNMLENFTISYSWNSDMEEAPAFVMDMMTLLNRIGRLGASTESTVADEPMTRPELTTEEENADEETVEEEEEKDEE